MIDLHHVGTPNGHKVTIALEELGLPYRTITYNLLTGDHFTPAFRSINPNNKLPVIVDNEPADGGAPLPVFETGAILIYLAEKYGQLLPKDTRRRTQAIQWLMWQMAGLGPMHGQAHHFVRYAPEGQTYATNRYVNEARRLLNVLEHRLGERGLDSQHGLAGVGKAVLAAGRHDDELARGERDVRLADPHLGLPFEHAQDFLDRVQVRWRAVARLAPLLEHAKLGRAV